MSDQQIEEIIRKTLESAPEAATHWSTRKMAKRCGFSRETVSRIWRAFGLAPHRGESFSLSSDPYFVEKVRDVVGLYLDPPGNALVLCVDEKTQVQALERSQPVLPMRPGQPERRMHDYYRHGTLSLFATLEVATGRIISATKPKHRGHDMTLDPVVKLHRSSRTRIVMQRLFQASCVVIVLNVADRSHADLEKVSHLRQSQPFASEI